MRVFFLGVVFFISSLSFATIPAYYNGINVFDTGNSLKQSLSSLITTTHTSVNSYAFAWDVLKDADAVPGQSKVLLIYGYNDTDGSHINDRTRSNSSNGGGLGDWNREHVYPKSLGNPSLGTSGPGADAHHLRASDVQMNSSRSNRKFIDGTGDARVISSSWYPGDEWKGDVARMMMYMYLRYGNRCLPKNVGIGNTVATDVNMIDLFLKWNVEDPVSDHEKNRNDEIYNVQGNRNPFIDNPSFATKIWGGLEAEDPFNILSITISRNNKVNVYPNPSRNGVVWVEGSSDKWERMVCFDVLGNQEDFAYLRKNEGLVQIVGMPKGVHFIKIVYSDYEITHRVLIL